MIKKIFILFGMLGILGILGLAYNSPNLRVGTVTTTGNFPTALNTFQDGDTIQAGDWNNIENTIGITGSASTTSLTYKLTSASSSDPGHKHSTSSVTGVFTPTNGGLGTSTAPTSGQIPIGNSSNIYVPAFLTAGTNISISTSSGAITINNSAAASVATTTINGVNGPTFTFNTSSTGTDFTISTSTAIVNFNLPTASASNRGLLSTTDWTTFNNKIGSLNGLTGATQTYASGTTGTDWGITSSGTTHTFNFPSSSASNRGLLTAADWTTFNNKLSAAITSLNGLTGASQTFATTTASNTFTISSSGTAHTLTIPSNVSYFSNDAGYTSSTGTISTSTAVTANYFPFWGTTSSLTGTSTIYQSSTRIGISTISPSTTLHVIGVIRGSGAPIFDALTGIIQGKGTSAASAITDSSTTGQVLRVTGVSTYAWGALNLASSDAVTGLLAVTNGGTGTSTAPYDLSVLTGQGGVYAQKTLTAGTNVTLSTSTGAITITATDTNSGGTVATSTAVTANYFPFWGSASALSGTSTIYASSSRIGISTISPSSTLHIVGNFQTTATSTLGSSLIVNTNLLYADAGTARVGIGTASPNAKVDVRDGSFILTDADVAHGITDLGDATETYARFYPVDSTAGGLGMFTLSDTGAVSGYTLLSVLGNADPTDSVPAIDIRGYKKSGTNIQALGSLETVLQISNATTPLLTALGGGNIGIGTVSPSTTLHVVGTGRLSGALTLDTALTVANGGTGATSFTSNGVLYGSSTAGVQVTAAGTSAQILQANASGVPGFVTVSSQATIAAGGAVTLQGSPTFTGITVNNTSTLQNVSVGRALFLPTVSPTSSQQLSIQTTSSTLVFRDSVGNRVVTATSTKGIMIASPTASEKAEFYVFPANATIGRASCTLGNAAGNTFTFNLQYGATYSASSTVFSSDNACTATTTPTIYSSFANSTPSKGDMIWLSSSAASTTQATIQIDFIFNE